jgi:hypothetical protein
MALGRQPRQFTPPSGRAQSPPTVSVLVSIRIPAAIISRANPARTSRGSRSRLTAAPAKAAPAPVAPKIPAMRQRICPPRSRGISAVAEESPTTTSDIGIAAAIGTPTP